MSHVPIRMRITGTKGGSLRYFFYGFNFGLSEDLAAVYYAQIVSGIVKKVLSNNWTIFEKLNDCCISICSS